MTAANQHLLKAAESGDLGGVSSALQAGANVNAKDQFNNTALNSAALFGHGEVVKTILEAGADIENRGSGGGLTPIVNAAGTSRSRRYSSIMVRASSTTSFPSRRRKSTSSRNCEADMVMQEALGGWKQTVQFFITATESGSSL